MSKIILLTRKHAAELLKEADSLSFPVPAVENGILINRFFVYCTAYQNMRTRPYAVLKADTAENTVLWYQNCYFADVFDTAQYPFDQLISYELPAESSGLSVVEYSAQYEKLFELYDDILRFAFADSVTDEQKALLKEFKEMFVRLTPAGLLPFYKALGSDFDRWIESVVG